MPLLTFIVPIRHQENARDWGVLCSRLQQTLASISNQTHDDWSCVVVANEGAMLPPLPKHSRAERVTFPPNEMHEWSKGSREAVLDAFRLDKGRRVLAGMVASPDSRFFMTVDDDDLVSAGLVAHVADNLDANGWYVDQGYLWDDGGRWFMKVDGFDLLCGTSLVIRRDLYCLPARPEDASVEWIKTMLGSHVGNKSILAERGAPLMPLPFAGAAYRVGSAGSHSQVRGILRMKLLNRAILSDPSRLINNLRGLRWIGPALRREFLGKPSTTGPAND